MRRVLFALALGLLANCDTDIGPIEEPTYPCTMCVNEKTCPAGVCSDSAYDACVAAKRIAKLCE